MRRTAKMSSHMNGRVCRLACTAAALFALMPLAAHAQQGAANPIASDGTVTVAPFPLPPSPYASAEARKAMPRRPTDPEAPMKLAVASGKAGEMRAREGEFMAATIKHLTDLYPSKMEAGTIAGVPAVTVTPARVPPANRAKILLNLPGGGFIMGAASGTGMVESIPLAAMAGVRIVSITYRQAPEAMFPAASEDVAKVYRALLKTHRPQDIGIFGCSAGGMLTAQATAWFIKEKLPLPRAIGLFCGSADARRVGDSQAYAQPFAALPPRDPKRVYFAPADVNNPLASPILDDAVLRRFPPTLIISSTRAADMSPAIATHRALTRLGVESQLEIWEGLGHAFFYTIDWPESKEAFGVMTRFFSRQMGLVRP